MFSGIIERTGEVAGFLPPVRRGDGPLSRRLSLRAGDFFHSSPPGASIAVDGVCLTLLPRTNAVDALGEFDVIVETLRRTSLDSLAVGHAVNLERSLRPADRIDGHFVQGHVDAVGRVVRIDRSDGEWKLRIAADPAALRCVIPKGSIALAGVSLTVVDVTNHDFSVALIPTTLERTNLRRLKPGDPVNVETDILSRTVVATLDRMNCTSDDALRRRLVESGFAV